MNVPKLRFKEFDGEYNKYKIEEMVTVTDCKHDTAPVEAEQTIYKMIRTGNVRNGNLLVKTMDSVSEDTFHKWSLRGYLESNDIILTREAPMGEVAIIPDTSEYKFFLGQRCLQLKTNIDLVNSMYIYFLFQGERFQKYIRPLKFSGSTVSNIRIPELKSFEFEVPVIEEQIKIGTFLELINKKIQLQQQKIDLLQEQKKGFLQKMFPKAGEKQPQVRFAGFRDDWEQRKLGDEADILAGGDVDKEKLKDSGNYPVFANALKNNGLVGYYGDYYRIEAPAVTVTGRGDVGHAQARKTNFTPVVRLLAVKSKHDVDFLENAINKHRVLVESTGIPQLTSPQLGNYKIFFSSFEEEQKIGTFFKKLDDTIALHQQKLDLYKEQKKGFMQQMFI